MKYKWKAPGTERLKLVYENLVSSFAFKVNMRRYIWDGGGCDGTARVHRLHGGCASQGGQEAIPGRAVQVDSIKSCVQHAYGFSA
jgi:hypothetical protein